MGHFFKCFKWDQGLISKDVIVMAKSEKTQYAADSAYCQNCHNFGVLPGASADHVLRNMLLLTFWQLNFVTK